MPPRNEPKERRCIVTRRTRNTEDLLRFALAPDGSVVPDLKARLPGRGVWITADRANVAEAEKKRLFGRAFKAEAHVEPGLAERVERLIETAALSSLSMARKAGSVVTGFAKVEAAIGKEALTALVIAADAADDGARKMMAALRRRFGDAGTPPVIRVFGSDQLGLALGRANVIHAALLEARASEAVVRRVRDLTRYRDGADRTDDEIGSRQAAPQD
ncbi:RNA-binding protein [Rhodobium gokarnense]|uniref:RNA-binding protein n=1 Tax=Rhodobium gokarnense TaxID=364296 RepID=UPI002224C16D|nr:RNA-binding protein [Rhodobium gokarnense]